MESATVFGEIEEGRGTCIANVDSFSYFLSQMTLLIFKMFSRLTLRLHIVSKETSLKRSRAYLEKFEVPVLERFSDAYHVSQRFPPDAETLHVVVDLRSRRCDE